MMIVWRGVTLAGGVLAAAGIIFHMQGRGVVGPEQSFMYNSPDWIQYGVWLVAAGAAAIIAALLIRRACR